MNILLVEDERPLALAIVRILRGAGYSVTWAPDGEQGYELAYNESFDAIVLDVLLPKKSGWQILEGVRAAKINTPILMLTAMDELGDKVKGLNYGADDYMTKPFEGQELVARLGALMRRDKANKGHIIRVADLTIDRDGRTVTRGGQSVPLTRREYDLLETLAINEGRILSREMIQQQVWSEDEAFANTVDVFIGTLQKKIDAPFDRHLIHAAHDNGYVLRSAA